jgi:predicted small lipoprotein YifL
MNLVRALIVLITVVTCAGCGGRSPHPEAPPSEPAAATASTAEAEVLDRPFTAEQIRNEWAEGFQVMMRRATPDSEQLERWTVIAADADGAEIEFALVGRDGSVIGAPVVQRSSWTELRDHAAFPAAAASREWVHRDTELGPLDGWLYRVSDEDPDAMTEFFFVPELPGAPVMMQVFENGQPTLTMEQLHRSNPKNP